VYEGVGEIEKFKLRASPAKEDRGEGEGRETNPLHDNESCCCFDLRSLPTPSIVSRMSTVLNEPS
jgi:hypothetical protein